MQLTGPGQNDRKFWTNWKKHGNWQLRCPPRWNETAIRINSAMHWNPNESDDAQVVVFRSTSKHQLMILTHT